MAHPWLSVIVPTYNGAGLVARALSSVAAQVGLDAEVIAIDDGSSDETVAVLKTFANRLPLRVIQSESRNGWVATTNRAISVSSGSYVSFLHQDDAWLPGRFAFLREVVGRHAEAVLFLHPVWYVNLRGERLGGWRCPLPPNRLLPPTFVVGRLLVQNFIAAPAPVFRRDAAIRMGLLDPALWYAADWDFWLKLAAAGCTVYRGQFLATFRIHPSSQTVNGSADVAGVRRQLHGVLEKHLRLWPTLARDACLRQTAAFGVELNGYLFARLHGVATGGAALLRHFLALGPDGWLRFFRDSRILERVRARWKAGIGRGERGKRG